MSESRDDRRDEPSTMSGHAQDRRALLAGAAGVVGAALFPTPTGSSEQVQGVTTRHASVDTTKSLGREPSEVGRRSPFERPRRWVDNYRASAASRTPLQDLDGLITPADLHFERHHGGVPTIDPASYRLLVHGMVERPTVFTLADLKRFPRASRLAFIECSGNGGRAYRYVRGDTTPQEIDGLTSTSDWIGVTLATLFREVGVDPRATWFLAEGQDAAVMTRSIPMEKAWDDAMIVYGQNGEAIRPEQGYPARLLLPGWEGNSQVKWLRRLEVSDRPFMTREETSRYTDPLGDGTVRQFSFVLDAKSIITFPAFPSRLSGRGWWEISGLAWSGRGKIAKVDVSTDAGATWRPAELQAPVLSKCHTRFRSLWHWDGADTVLMSRAVDETGYVQPTWAQLEAVRGAGTAYHLNNVRAWRVRSDGTVRLHHEVGT